MNNYSLLQFGSSLREDFDSYSDKDLLIVTDTFDQLNSLKEDYESNGFSVSSYTYEKMQLLCDRESLFIEHLRRESRIIFDCGDKIKTLIQKTPIAIPSEERILEAANYFHFLKTIPNTAVGFTWFCDCFYVGLRNYLINLSAKKGLYTFSYPKLINELRDSYALTTGEVQILNELRVAKKNYRSNPQRHIIENNFLPQISEIANKIGIQFQFSAQPIRQFQADAQSNLTSSNLHKYQKLRLVEILYHLRGDYIPLIEKAILNPQLYASWCSKSETVQVLLHLINESEVEVTSKT
jgi:hypothetical protein